MKTVSALNCGHFLWTLSSSTWEIERSLWTNHRCNANDVMPIFLFNFKCLQTSTNKWLRATPFQQCKIYNNNFFRKKALCKQNFYREKIIKTDMGKNLSCQEWKKTQCHQNLFFLLNFLYTQFQEKKFSDFGIISFSFDFIK